jgi:hypothetical protein
LLAASALDLPPDLARLSSLVCPHAPSREPGGDDGGNSIDGGGRMDPISGAGLSRRLEGPGSTGATGLFSYAAAGASGGAADFVFRSAAAELFGITIPEGQPLPWVAGRNADTSELTLRVEGEVKLRCAGPGRVFHVKALKISTKKAAHAKVYHHATVPLRRPAHPVHHSLGYRQRPHVHAGRLLRV